MEYILVLYDNVNVTIQGGFLSCIASCEWKGGRLNVTRGNNRANVFLGAKRFKHIRIVADATAIFKGAANLSRRSLTINITGEGMLSFPSFMLIKIKIIVTKGAQVFPTDDDVMAREVYINIADGNVHGVSILELGTLVMRGRGVITVHAKKNALINWMNTGSGKINIERY